MIIKELRKALDSAEEAGGPNTVVVAQDELGRCYSVKITFLEEHYDSATSTLWLQVEEL